MQEIEMPDGTILEFPDNMTDDQIRAALQAYSGQAPAPQPVQEPKTWGQTLKDNLIGDNDPTTQNFGETVGQLINKGIEGATFGLIGDEAAAAGDALMGTPYDAALKSRRQQEQILQDNHPVLNTAAEIGGAMMLPIGAAGQVAKAPGLMNLGKRMGAAGATTGAMSGLYGFAEGEGGVGPRSANARDAMALGAGIGAAIPLAGGAVEKAVNPFIASRAVRKAVKGAPTTAEQHAKGTALYKLIDDAGVQIKTSKFDQAKAEILDYLQNNTGYDELPGGPLTPKSARVMQTMNDAGAEMAKEPTSALPFKAIDQMRRRAGAAARDVGNPADQAAGMGIINGLDDMVMGLKPDDVVAGDIDTLQRLLPKARDTWAKMSKSQKIDDAIEAGQDAYLSGPGTGIKYQFKRLLKDKNFKKSLTPAEKAVMSRVVNGSIPEQILRLAGSGLTHIMGPMAAFGGVGGGIPGMAAGAGALGLSRLAREGSDKLIERNAETARALVAKGGMEALPTLSQSKRGLLESLMGRSLAVGQQ